MLQLAIGLLCSVAQAEYIFVGGGFGAANNTMSMYNGEEWVTMPNMTTGGYGLILITFQDKLYRIGGRSGAATLNTVEYYDGIWRSTSTPLLQERYYARGYVGVDQASQEKLCVVGGARVSQPTLASVECFNGTAWSFAKSLNTTRHSFGLSKFGTKMCAVGGIDASGTYLASWECQDTFWGDWTMVVGSTLQQPRQSFGIAFIQQGNGGSGMLCIAGGLISGGVPTKTLECTNPSNLWMNMDAPLLTHRMYSPMVPYQGLYCMIGGQDVENGNTYLDTVECYNPGPNTWSYALNNLTMARASHAAALYQPPTFAPTRFPTQAPTTGIPTFSPTRDPTRSPSTLGPSRSPTTLQPTPAPTLPGCASLSPVDNGKGNCNFTPHLGNCTQTCAYGVASGDEFRLCLNGVWGNLVCNSPPPPTPAGAQVAAPAPDFFDVLTTSPEGIVSIAAVVLFILLVILLVYICVRCKRKKRAENSSIAMTVLPPYTEQGGDFVFPDANPPPDPDSGDPFAADKAQQQMTQQASEAAMLAAAEKVRQDQLNAYQQAQVGASVDDGKHSGSPGYGGVSRLTVT